MQFIEEHVKIPPLDEHTEGKQFHFCVDTIIMAIIIVNLFLKCNFRKQKVCLFHGWVSPSNGCKNNAIFSFSVDKYRPPACV